MPTRDEEDFERRRQQIMDGALRAFAEKGYEKATNQDIARAAGVRSPGLIYHYFRDKADLFQRMLERHAPVLGLIAHADDYMSMPPHEALTMFARAMLSTFTNPAAISVLKVMLGESTRRPAVAELLNATGPRRGFTFLSRYMARQMDAGRLRHMDPAVAVRCFVGPLVAYVLTREIFPQADAQLLNPETMAEAAVEVFLRGMAVVPEPYEAKKPVLA
jgi:AcrR family transcriptional regulator